jgi:hypothetical protein
VSVRGLRLAPMLPFFPSHVLLLLLNKRYPIVLLDDGRNLLLFVFRT